jgi:hypothetical protein
VRPKTEKRRRPIGLTALSDAFGGVWNSLVHARGARDRAGVAWARVRAVEAELRVHFDHTLLVFAGHRRVRRDVRAERLTILCAGASGWLVDVDVAVIVATIARFSRTRTARFVVIVAVFLAKALAFAKCAFLTFLIGTDAITVAISVDAVFGANDAEFITKTVGTAFVGVQTIRVGHALEFTVILSGEVNRATGPKARDKAYTCDGN